MIELLILALVLAGLVATLLGIFTLWHLLRPKKAPADASNRINHIRLWWFSLTREYLFVDLFPWLKRDELDNTKNQQS